MSSDNNTGESEQVPSVPSAPSVLSSAAKLREALKEIEAHITATLAHQPDDDAECGQLLYDALVKVFDIADMACHERRDLRKYNNAAKLREAVKAVVDVGYPHNFQKEAPHIRGYCYDITRAIDKCFAALAAPPRNCDIGTLEEQVVRYRKFCYETMNKNNHCCGPCPVYKWVDGEVRPCNHVWALLPYESEAKS